MQDKSRRSARTLKHSSPARSDGRIDGDGPGQSGPRDADPESPATDGDGNQSEQHGQGKPEENVDQAAPVAVSQVGESAAGYGQDSGFGESEQGSLSEDGSGQGDQAERMNRGASTSSHQDEGRGEMPQPQTNLVRPGESGWGQRNDERGSEHIGGGQQREGGFEYGGPGSHQDGGSPDVLPSHPDAGEKQKDQGAQVGKRHSKVRPRKAT